MYDFHAHMLPNLLGDDGPKSKEISQRMISQASETGFSDVIAVSHLIPGEAYEPCASLVEKAAAQSTLELRLHGAHECYLMPELIKIIKNREAAVIGGRYILVELPMTNWMPNTLTILMDILSLGMTPVISHPERCEGIEREPDRALELLHIGAKLQLNLDSLKDKKSYKGRVALWLLKHRAYHVVGTDAHSDRRRSPLMSDELVTLKTLVGAVYFNFLLRGNPERMLRGADAVDGFDGIWEADDIETNQGTWDLHAKRKQSSWIRKL
ncbi:tyrosine-protein phosphatase [Acidaminobacter hydrogenoformans]|uniref:protein-tyrosine-phosphatase n=1 Tax=Acidaminobacter hydrogenoformans DSM 2784 TaxID=1120920 RepID=A0A1G5RS11_9FIRM|nr:CpsB/CapC family capsule biosynthesis tyrosine phosphatase [Acidaminobacter hydrogenoformans]SCZ76049.1 Tyrosine-protein phosphatase YwqE [Acidaminobacter hydrogenoformans DSM 2784]